MDTDRSTRKVRRLFASTLFTGAFLFVPSVFSSNFWHVAGFSALVHAQHNSNGFEYVVTRGTSHSSPPIPVKGNQNLIEHGFRFFCVPSHFSYNDPIVYPGQDGAAHLHMFFGNTDVDAFSTSESIVNLGNSTCDGGITNRSAYWIPALYNEDNQVVLPSVITLYYKSWVSDRSVIQPIPAGLQILANDKVKGSTGVVVSTVDREIWKGTIRVYEHDNSLHIEIRFPDCVAVDADRKPVLTSPSGTRHVAYSSGSCPLSHPYTIPQLTQIISWNDISFASEWRLSSDLMKDSPKGTTMHADYVAAWTEDAARTMSDCVRDGYRECGPALQLHWSDQFFSPDGEQIYDYFKVADGVDLVLAELNDWPHVLSVHH